MIRMLTYFYFLLGVLFLSAQNTADVRLEQSRQTDETVCYNIDVRHSSGDESVMLAGQNYRFFVLHSSCSW